VKAANWFGSAPHATWVDGSIDYTYDKYNQHSIGHAHLHENRKNKPFRNRKGGDKVPEWANKPIGPTYVHQYLPKGCAKEINKYKRCVSDKKDAVACIDQKISIVEVCPKWVLESLREKKRVLLRATLIDNETYRRAMRVSDYNKGRSLRAIKEETRGARNIRGDSYLFDDRYNPTSYPSADQNTNVNIGKELAYNDVLGGNIIEKIEENRKMYSKNSYEYLKNMSELEGKVSDEKRE
jgi:hypothetical protein